VEEQSSDIRHFFHFRFFSDPIANSSPCAAMPSWFRLKMKLDPKATDRVREAAGVFEKAFHPPSEKSAARATIAAQTEFWEA
jgi:hypothetical protein